MRENNKKENKKSVLDKIVMGAIIGTAVGSALGVSVAPKKGKETRKSLKKRSKEMGKLTKETASGLWGLGKRIFCWGKKKGKKVSMKKIPNETEVIPTEYVDRD